MKKIKLILLFGIIILSITSCLLHHKQPADKLDFINSQNDVTDSLNTLRDLKRFILTSDYVTNCYIGYDNELVINYAGIGDFEYFVNGGKVDMETVKQVYTGDIYRLISLMAYLKKIILMVIILIRPITYLSLTIENMNMAIEQAIHDQYFLKMNLLRKSKVNLL